MKEKERYRDCRLHLGLMPGNLSLPRRPCYSLLNKDLPGGAGVTIYHDLRHQVRLKAEISRCCRNNLHVLSVLTIYHGPCCLLAYALWTWICSPAAKAGARREYISSRPISAPSCLAGFSTWSINMTILSLLNLSATVPDLYATAQENGKKSDFWSLRRLQP
jgi:hypothetical protein